MPRIRQIRIDGLRTDLEGISKTMDGPAPLLENFVFRDISPVDSRDAERIPLPALLFNNQTPHLQRLSIHQTLALSNTVAFRHSLRHLKISAADRAPSLLEMLGTLEQFSLLETLKFSYAPLFEYDASLEVQPVSRRYALPQLLSIQLEAYALECTNVLNHLTLPRITTITLHCLSETGASDLARYLTSKISPQCHPRSLCIRRDFRQLTIHMQGFDAEPSVCVGHGLEGVAVQIDLSYDPSDHVASSHTLQTVCEGLPLSEIQDLQVWSLRHPHDWAMLLSRTENVSTLCAYNVNDALPLALCNSVSNNGELESLLPNLRVLKLHEVDFRNCANLHKGLQGRFMSILCTYLMLRYEYGAEVRRLEVKRGINVKETDIQLLKEIVASVSWDGIFKDSEDFYSDNLIQYDDDDAFLW